MSRFDGHPHASQRLLYESYGTSLPVTRADLISIQAQDEAHFLWLMSNNNFIAFYPFFTDDAEQYLNELELLGRITPRNLTDPRRSFYIGHLERYLSLKSFSEGQARALVITLLENHIGMHLSSSLLFRNPQEAGYRNISEAEFRGVHLNYLICNENISDKVRDEIVTMAKERFIPLITADHLEVLICGHLLRYDYASP